MHCEHKTKVAIIIFSFITQLRSTMYSFYNFTYLSRLYISWTNSFHALMDKISVTSKHLKNLHLALLFDVACSWIHVKSNSMSTNFPSLLSYSWTLFIHFVFFFLKTSQIIHTQYTNKHSVLDQLNPISYQNRVRFSLYISLLKKIHPLLMNLWRFRFARSWQGK